MEKCAAVLLREPEALRGRWLQTFPPYTKLHLELGCGKGGFTCKTAMDMPGVFLAAVERVPEALVVAMERATAAELPNVRFLCADVASLLSVFADGEAERIYINFCDPWPGGKKHARRRLTAQPFLQLYRRILSPGGEIHFKTDNAPLFEWSLEQFALCGFSLTQVTHDLHRDGIRGVMTDFEEKYHSQGIPICRCVAIKPEDGKENNPIEEPSGN